MLTLKAILHPTDFSPSSEVALKLAASLARDHGARLEVVHVVQPPAVAIGESLLEPAWEEIKQEARAALDSLPSPDPALPLEKRLLDGDPAEQILQAAADLGCDLIVMGTHGRGGLARLLMGSVAEQVVRKAACPVLTLKASAHLT